MLYCGPKGRRDFLRILLRKCEVFAYVGSIQNLQDLTESTHRSCSQMQGARAQKHQGADAHEEEEDGDTRGLGR